MGNWTTCFNHLLGTDTTNMARRKAAAATCGNLELQAKVIEKIQKSPVENHKGYHQSAAVDAAIKQQILPPEKAHENQKRAQIKVDTPELIKTKPIIHKPTELAHSEENTTTDSPPKKQISLIDPRQSTDKNNPDKSDYKLAVLDNPNGSEISTDQPRQQQEPDYQPPTGNTTQGQNIEKVTSERIKLPTIEINFEDIAPDGPDSTYIEGYLQSKAWYAAVNHTPEINETISQSLIDNAKNQMPAALIDELDKKDVINAKINWFIAGAVRRSTHPEYVDFIQKVGAAYDIDPNLMIALFSQESAFNMKACGDPDHRPDAAFGISQVKRANGRSIYGLEQKLIDGEKKLVFENNFRALKKIAIDNGLIEAHKFKQYAEELYNNSVKDYPTVKDYKYNIILSAILLKDAMNHHKTNVGTIDYAMVLLDYYQGRSKATAENFHGDFKAYVTKILYVYKVLDHLHPSQGSSISQSSIERFFNWLLSLLADLFK